MRTSIGVETTTCRKQIHKQSAGQQNRTARRTDENEEIEERNREENDREHEEIEEPRKEDRSIDYP